MVRPWPYWPHRFLRPCLYVLLLLIIVSASNTKPSISHQKVNHISKVCSLKHIIKLLTVLCAHNIPVHRLCTYMATPQSQLYLVVVLCFMCCCSAVSGEGRTAIRHLFRMKSSFLVS